MKVLLFFLSGAWHSWERWKRCAEVVGPAGFLLFFLLFCFVLLLFFQMEIWFVFFPLSLMVFIWFFLLMKPDWYTTIKYDDGRKAYFAVFGTRYLYHGSEWQKGRFVCFSFDRGFDVFHVVDIFYTGKVVLVETEKDGYVVYQSSGAKKIFIGSELEYCNGLFDNGQQISVLIESGVFVISYNAGKCLCDRLDKLVCSSGVSYTNMINGEVLDDTTFRERQYCYGYYGRYYLALQKENGKFALYALLRKNLWSFGQIYRIAGGKKLETVNGSVYVADQQDCSLYQLEK